KLARLTFRSRIISGLNLKLVLSSRRQLFKLNLRRVIGLRIDRLPRCFHFVFAPGNAIANPYLARTTRKPKLTVALIGLAKSSPQHRRIGCHFADLDRFSEHRWPYRRLGT